MHYSTMESQKRTLKPPIKIAILEKTQTDVSYCWKACQLFSYVIVVISGIATSMAFGNVQRMFLDECLLYSNLTVESVLNNSEIILKPIMYQEWGPRNSCNFCQFCPVASVICAGIWGTLFVMCGRGGGSSRSLPQPWRIVPPAIVFNFIFVVLSCVSVVLTFGGFSAFCSSIQSSVNISSCEDLMDFRWNHYPNATYFYDDVIIAETGAAISLAGWLMGFVILLIRCITHADFMVLSQSPKSGSGQSHQPGDNSESQSTASTSVHNGSGSTSGDSSPSSPLSQSLATTPQKEKARPTTCVSIEVEPLIEGITMGRGNRGTGAGPMRKTKNKS